MRIIELPFNVKRPILACGADMKGAFALARRNKAYLVEGFGDLGDADNLQAYERAVSAWEKKLKLWPMVIACDMHPGYFSARFAEAHAHELSSSNLCYVQHHEAHVASAIAEHGIKGDVIGVAFDGTGYGLDGRLWGAEFLLGSLKGLRRAAHLEYVPMAGGDAAVRQPWRMACSYLHKAFGEGFMKLDIAIIKKICRKRLYVIKTMIDRRINSPLTSSVGRLFDAVGSLVLSTGTASSEAFLPMELERIAAKDCGEAYKFNMRRDGDGMIIVKTSAVIKAIINDLNKKVDRAIISAKFHNTAANIIVNVSVMLSKESGARNIVLTGGVFQNKYLVAKIISLLKNSHFRIYAHSNVNTNDYGIPIGQLAIADKSSPCV